MKTNLRRSCCLSRFRNFVLSAFALWHAMWLVRFPNDNIARLCLQSITLFLLDISMNFNDLCILITYSGHVPQFWGSIFAWKFLLIYIVLGFGKWLRKRAKFAPNCAFLRIFRCGEWSKQLSVAFMWLATGRGCVVSGKSLTIHKLALCKAGVLNCFSALVNVFIAPAGKTSITNTGKTPMNCFFTFGFPS